MAGRDMEALARGLGDVMELPYLEFRIGQVAYLAELLLAGGVPLVEPPGGHAVYVDARRFLPHIPQEQFPAQVISVELYLEGGIRALELGSIAFKVTNRWADQKGVSSEPDELLANEEFKTMLTEEIKSHLKKNFGRYEIPEKYLFIREDFTVENNMLTQTMKLKRRVVIDRYANEIEKLYS